MFDEAQSTNRRSCDADRTPSRCRCAAQSSQNARRALAALRAGHLDEAGSAAQSAGCLCNIQELADVRNKAGRSVSQTGLGQ